VLNSALEQEDHGTVHTLLREYVYRTVNWGNDGLQLKRALPQGVKYAKPLRVLELLEAKEISLLCGGTSHLLSNLYRAFGYDSSTYNYGIRGASTHVIALVAEPTPSGLTLAVQDGTFNLSLSYKNSFDFPQVIEALASGYANEITSHQGKSSHRHIYFNPQEDIYETLSYYSQHDVLLENLRTSRSLRTQSEYLYALGDIGLESYRRRREQDILAALSQDPVALPHPPHVLMLMLYIIERPQFTSSSAQESFSCALPYMRETFALQGAQ
jgi:hypothetical protein